MEKAWGLKYLMRASRNSKINRYRSKSTAAISHQIDLYKQVLFPFLRYAAVEALLSFAIRRPMFPKQTLLQKRTLAIQVATAMLSSVIKFSFPNFWDNSAARTDLVELVVGRGTTAGLTKRRATVPKIPTAADNQNPACVRSIVYHRQGLTSARVSEACIVDCH